MKKTNKGFSMVELIIVIAIMAILAGAIAPALIKYINRSRLSSDIQTGQSVATAMQTALANESCYDDAVASYTTTTPTALPAPTGSFWTEVNSTIAISGIKGKAKKDVAGSTLDQTYYYTLDPANNKIEVYVGGTASGNQVFPSVGSLLAQ